MAAVWPAGRCPDCLRRPGRALRAVRRWLAWWGLLVFRKRLPRPVTYAERCPRCGKWWDRKGWY